MKRIKLFWQIFPFLILLSLISFYTPLLFQSHLNIFFYLLPILLALVICKILTLKIGKPLNLLYSHAKNHLHNHQQENALKSTLLKGVSTEVKQLEHIITLLVKKLKKAIKLVDKQTKDREILFSSMMEGMVTFDLRGNIVHINKAAIDLNGLENQNLTNRPIIEIFRHPIIEEMSRVILRGGKGMQEEIELKNKILQISASSLQDDQHNTWGGFFIFRDITRIHQLENHQREFVANVSHELRTPLTSIQGFVETLLDNPTTKERDKFLKIIQRQAGRLNSIVENLLTLAQLERNQKEGQINFKKTNISSIISSAIQTCEHKIRKKNIQLKLEELETPLKDCRVNASLLEQALINLIDNAVKYSEIDTKIFISYQIDKEHLTISVKDQGLGIHHSHIPHLFERFYIIDKARSIDQGTGLGLAIVKNIILIHGGDISVQSTLGKGSIFTMILPR